MLKDINFLCKHLLRASILWRFTNFVIPTTHPAVVVLTLDNSFELQSKSVLFAENSFYYCFHRLTDFATFPTTHQWICARVEKSKSF